MAPGQWLTTLVLAPGVRNPQAKNNLLAMRQGEQAFFYHSSCKTPGIVGIVEVEREAEPDGSAFDPSSKYYDPKSTTEKPKWVMTHIRLVSKRCRPVGDCTLL